jgi:hypothetical protein
MRNAEFEDCVRDAWSQAIALGMRGITRADVRRKMIDAAISAHGYCVLLDDVSGAIFDATTGEPRPTWPEDLHPAPDLRLVE